MSRAIDSSRVVNTPNNSHRSQVKTMIRCKNTMRAEKLLQRRGSILVLTALLLPVLFLLAAFVINIAYLQLSKTELMVATDAAARTASRALSEYQDVELAKDAARATAALNSVAGSPLQLNLNDELLFGVASNQYVDGRSTRFAFTAIPEQDVASGAATANAIQLTGNRTTDSEDGEINFPFPVFNNHTWRLSHSTTTLHLDRDVALVLDRSGSMAWRTYAWPTAHGPWHPTIYAAAEQAGLLYSIRFGRTRQYYYAQDVTPEIYQDWVWTDFYEMGPLPPSAWDDLKVAVDQFLTVMEQSNQTGYIGLASYASDSSVDLRLQSSHAAVRNHLNQLSPVGATAIGDGIERGAEILLDQDIVHPFAVKTMIVMTDGMHNWGTDPIEAAQALVDEYDIVIHAVTFSAGADQDRMRQVAAIGRGRHYHAETGEQLASVFREIAFNLPTLTVE